MSDDDIAGDIAGYDLLMLHMEAGKVNEAVDMAKAANLFVELNERGRLMIAVDGLDDDPREIDQTPQGRATLAALFEALSPKAWERMDETHRALMLVAVGLAERIGNTIAVYP